jgi:hypothetical protein
MARNVSGAVLELSRRAGLAADIPAVVASRMIVSHVNAVRGKGIWHIKGFQKTVGNLAMEGPSMADF